jgi:hypothetical protein
MPLIFLNPVLSFLASLESSQFSSLDLLIAYCIAHPAFSIISLAFQFLPINNFSVSLFFPLIG